MKPYEDTTILVAAAGIATRMKSENTPKALVKFRDHALIDWATSAFTPYIKRLLIVIRREAHQAFSNHFKNSESQDINFVYQNVPLGTGYAIRDGLMDIETEWVLVVWGDQVGASRAKIPEIFAIMESSDADFYLPIVSKRNPYVYFDISKEGRLIKFYETNSGAPKIDQGFSDCGFFLFKKKEILDFLEMKLRSDLEEENIEINFLSLFSEMDSVGIKIKIIFLEDELLTVGINKPDEINYYNEIFNWDYLNGR